MAVQLINIGNVANDGTGDDLREAMIKINTNFEELDLRDDEQTSVLNLGFGTGLFKQKVGYTLEFKTIAAGTDVTLVEAANVLTIAADGGIKTLSLISDTSTYVVPDIGDIQILGGANIGTTLIDNKLYVSYNGPTDVVDDTTPALGGNLDADSNNISNVATLTADNVVGLVHGIDIRNNSFLNLDLGEIVQNITTSLDFFLSANNVDYGSITSPSTANSEFGTLV